MDRAVGTLRAQRLARAIPGNGPDESGAYDFPASVTHRVEVGDFELLVVERFVRHPLPTPMATPAAVCAQLNFSQKVSMMRGYGEIAGYSRNSGCAGVCHRDTFRWCGVAML